MTAARGPVRIIAYVCEGGVVYEVNDEGYSSFSDLFRRNPDGCRYAVTVTPQGAHVVFDMHDFKIDAKGNGYPGRHMPFPSYDVAMAAAIMLPPIDFISGASPTTQEDNNMFAASYSFSGVDGYAAAKTYFETCKPWRGETDALGERPTKHRRARTMGVRMDEQGSIRFRLHRTDVVIYRPDGSIRLNVYASVTTDAFANAFLGRDIYTSFNSGHILVGDRAYRAVSSVEIGPKGEVTPTEKWARYVVNRKTANAARRAHPHLAEARAWLRARDALQSQAPQRTDLWSVQRMNIADQLEWLKDRNNWPALTEGLLDSMDYMLVKTEALDVVGPYDSISRQEIAQFQASVRRWGAVH